MPNADEGSGVGGETPRRVFRAADGVMWSVREREAGRDASWPAGRTLVFESEAVIRRVKRYPRDWYRLRDEELERLSWTT